MIVDLSHKAFSVSLDLLFVVALHVFLALLEGLNISTDNQGVFLVAIFLKHFALVFHSNLHVKISFRFLLFQLLLLLLFLLILCILLELLDEVLLVAVDVLFGASIINANSGPLLSKGLLDNFYTLFIKLTHFL